MHPGERIKTRRGELGYTQDQLAAKAGLSKGFLSDVENGKRGIGAEALLDLARVLGVKVDYLLTGDDGSAATRAEVEIPRALADFADASGLSFRQTLLLLDMQRQIIAHRSASRRADGTEFDWAKFHQSVKDFI